MTNTMSTDAGRHAHTDQVALIRDDENAVQRLQLSEIHHRIRNGLNLICCTLQLQARRSGNPEVRDALSRIADRINSLARIHELLDGHGCRCRTHLSSYLKNLSDDLPLALLSPEGRRTVGLNYADSMELGEDKLTALGWIVTELVTNAVKYGAGDVVISV